VAFSPYEDLLLKEAQIIGSADHLAQEIPLLIELARRRDLRLSTVIAGTVPLEAGPINEVLDRLEQGQAPIRTVILP
jgi:D-arabinose 1-dehydrogenase-like Zn-dependent alcohol dehydrogenase